MGPWVDADRHHVQVVVFEYLGLTPGCLASSSIGLQGEQSVACRRGTRRGSEMRRDSLENIAFEEGPDRWHELVSCRTT